MREIDTLIYLIIRVINCRDMKRLLFFVLSCLCIISTLSAQVIPLWLKERPMSISQYIGIGSVPLTVSNFREAARLAATNEIASQISVTVESN